MKTFHYHVPAGEHIDRAIQWACKLAKQHRALIRFDFNGAVLVASPKTAAHTLQWLFAKRTGERASRWRQSPAGQRAAARRKQEVASKSQELADLMDSMERRIARGYASLLHWLDDFTVVADDVAVAADLPRVRNALVALGFVGGQHVGRPKEDFDDAAVLAQYIVGQAISCMDQGMPPHPITTLFVTRWLEAHDEGH